MLLDEAGLKIVFRKIRRSYIINKIKGMLGLIHEVLESLGIS